MSGQSLIVDDVSEVPQFASDIAESTGYVPRSIVAAPLIRHGECVGVLEVLDRGTRDRGELDDVDIVGMLATEATLGLELLVRLRSLTTDMQSEPSQAGGLDLTILRRITERLPAADEQTASMVMRLLAVADELLTGADDGRRGFG
jgi:GAF domain-containing protein